MSLCEEKFWMDVPILSAWVMVLCKFVDNKSGPVKTGPTGVVDTEL